MVRSKSKDLTISFLLFIFFKMHIILTGGYMNEYTLELKKILKQAEREKNELQSEYIEIEHFILSILLTENNIKNILNSYGINYEKYKKAIVYIVDYHFYYYDFYFERQF